MLNAVKYRDRIFDICKHYSKVAMRDGQPVGCEGTPCASCEFNGSGTSCIANFIYWLYDEVDEHELTERQYCFFKSFPPETDVKLTSEGLTTKCNDIRGIIPHEFFEVILPKLPLKPYKWYSIEDILSWPKEF